MQAGPNLLELPSVNTLFLPYVGYIFQLTLNTLKKKEFPLLVFNTNRFLRPRNNLAQHTFPTSFAYVFLQLVT